jgi:phosphomevalonate kinase
MLQVMLHGHVVLDIQASAVVINVVFRRGVLAVQQRPSMVCVKESEFGRARWSRGVMSFGIFKRGRGNA